MVDLTENIVKALVIKGFSEKDANLMANNAKGEDICKQIERQKDKGNTLLGLFSWSDSAEGRDFWLEKYKKLEIEALEGKEA